MEFTTEDEKTLISTMETKTLLWNVQHPCYHRKELKEKAYGEVAERLGRSVTAVKTKWGNLRSAFSREQRKVKESCRSGAGADDVYRPKWIHYKNLLFLTSACKERQSESNLILTPEVEDAQSSQSTITFPEDEGEGTSICETSEDGPAQQEESVSTGGAVDGPGSSRKKQRTVDNCQAAKLELLKAAVSSMSSVAASHAADECDAFGVMMANCVRAVPEGPHRQMTMFLSYQAAIKYSVSLTGMHAQTIDILEPTD
ncbi:uncharacterized protein LOC135376404 [Ornithodoros turicata]|uniref:uncharacterized protein LOC135376404 n=1 Tax=Ornithodoros turicata TaxID=34597 RepID=UPI00313A419B